MQEANFLTAIILGIVEGLTEYIPVSSTGHLILVGHWINYTGEEASSFKIFIQLGAILAVVFYYHHRFRLLLEEIFRFDSEKFKKELNWLHLLLCILPAVIVGFLSYQYIKTYLFSPVTVSIGLVLGGIVMIYADRIIRGRVLTESLDQISYKQAFLVGIAQCFSLWPGVSRSAATILGGLFSGMNYRVAAEFSFLVAVPVIAIAILYDLYKSFHVITQENIGLFLLGGLVAFGVAYFSLSLFLKLLHRYKLVPFGWYRIASCYLCYHQHKNTQCDTIPTKWH